MSKKKTKNKFYAIKEGKGVSNSIVNTWDECSKLVLGYNSVYKSFKTREEAEKYLDIVNTEEVKEKTIKSIQAKRSRKVNSEIIKIELPKDLYLDFIDRCADMEMDKEKVIKELVKEWLD
jgi:viroplasmin and RNaseH domain-containing protein